MARAHRFNLPVKGMSHGAGMKRGKRGVNKKLHRIKNRGGHR